MASRFRYTFSRWMMKLGFPGEIRKRRYVFENGEGEYAGSDYYYEVCPPLFRYYDDILLTVGSEVSAFRVILMGNFIGKWVFDDAKQINIDVSLREFVEQTDIKIKEQFDSTFEDD